MTEVFFDTNVLYRAVVPQAKQANQMEVEQAEEAKRLLAAVEEGRLDGFVSILALASLYSLLEAYYRDNKWRLLAPSWQIAERRARQDAYNSIIRLASLFTVSTVLGSDYDTVRELMSKNLQCNDFEDNLQLICTKSESVKIIVTFNKRDFACANGLGIEALTPKQLLLRLTNA